MAKEPENITPVILREIRAKQDDLAEGFRRVEARLGNVEKQLSSLSKAVTYSLGQSTETQLRQVEQEARIDGVFDKLEQLLSPTPPSDSPSQP